MNVNEINSHWQQVRLEIEKIVVWTVWTGERPATLPEFIRVHSQGTCWLRTADAMTGKVARALSWHSTVHELFLSESIVFCKDTSEAIKSSGLNAAADHEMLSSCCSIERAESCETSWTKYQIVAEKLYQKRWKKVKACIQRYCRYRGQSFQ